MHSFRGVRRAATACRPQVVTCPVVRDGKVEPSTPKLSIEALITTYTFVGVPYYNYSIMGFKNLF